MSSNMYWSHERNEFVSAAEHFGYAFEHSSENLIGDWEALARWEEENDWPGFDMNRFISDNIELDYDSANYYISPNADLDPYIKQEVEDQC